MIFDVGLGRKWPCTSGRRFRAGFCSAEAILTRPLGATLGDLLDKPLSSGGLNFSRWVASLVLLGTIVACIALIPQRAAKKGDAV